MCFSQGCSLASSFLLYNQSTGSPPLFKAAVFICGGVPLDVLSSLGVDVTDEAREIDEASKVALREQASSEAILRDGYDRWTGNFDPLDENGEPRVVFGIDIARVPKELKIPIPTVHVFGRQDPRFPAGVTLAQFCDETVRRTFDHGGGHEIPRKRDVSETLAELVEWSGLMAEKWW